MLLYLVIEIVALVALGSAIGLGWTLLVLLAGSVVGLWLARREGVRAAEERAPELRTARIRAQAPVVDGEVVEPDVPRPNRLVIEGTVVPGDSR